MKVNQKTKYKSKEEKQRLSVHDRRERPLLIC